jgi:hypothetical protein
VLVAGTAHPVRIPQETTMKLSRTLVAALAVAAMLAPTAVAMPVDGPIRPTEGTQDMRGSVAEALAKERYAKERIAAAQTCTRPSTCETDAKNRVQAQQLPGPPTWPVNPQPITSPPAEFAETSADDGIDWATIAIGVGLTFVALGAITGVTHRIRVRRPRVVG